MSDIIFNHQAIHSPYHDVRKVQKEIKPGSDPAKFGPHLGNKCQHDFVGQKVILLVVGGTLKWG